MNRPRAGSATGPQPTHTNPSTVVWLDRPVNG
jgi:hypothetical protein